MENTELYNLRNRIAKNRENLKDNTQKYVEVNTNLDTVKTTLDNVKSAVDMHDNKVSELEQNIKQLQDKQTLTFDDMQKTISEWSKAELQPILDELCNDIESCIAEVKLFKSKVDKMVIRPIDDDMISNNGDLKSLSVSKIGNPASKLQLQKKRY